MVTKEFKWLIGAGGKGDTMRQKGAQGPESLRPSVFKAHELALISFVS